MANTSGSESSTTPAQSNVLIVDMGKRKKKDIKRLRRGRGKLMDRISNTMVQLKEEGELPEGSPVVVVLVREKRKKSGWTMW